jgi:hypothetical protein
MEVRSSSVRQCQQRLNTFLGIQLTELTITRVSVRRLLVLQLPCRGATQLANIKAITTVFIPRNDSIRTVDDSGCAHGDPVIGFPMQGC